MEKEKIESNMMGMIAFLFWIRPFHKRLIVYTYVYIYNIHINKMKAPYEIAMFLPFISMVVVNVSLSATRFAVISTDGRYIE